MENNNEQTAVPKDKKQRFNHEQFWRALFAIVVIAALGYLIGYLHKKSTVATPTNSYLRLSSKGSKILAETSELKSEITQKDNKIKQLESELENKFNESIILIRSIPYCLREYTGDREYFINTFEDDERVRPSIIVNFFNNKELIELEENGRLRQVCYSGRHEISFVMYGDYGDYNNVIGIYAAGELVLQKLYNKGGGDEGICTIDGYLERNVLYSCGGGDGPWGHNSIYVLDGHTGSSTTVKKCIFAGDEESCEVNLLGLKQFPF